MENAKIEKLKCDYVVDFQTLCKSGNFWNLEACGQTVLPDRSLLVGKKLAKNAKIEKFKCDILDNFQTLWIMSNIMFKLLAR